MDLRQTPEDPAFRFSVRSALRAYMALRTASGIIGRPVLVRAAPLPPAGRASASHEVLFPYSVCGRGCAIRGSQPSDDPVR